jgi:hypothetical protein
MKELTGISSNHSLIDENGDKRYEIIIITSEIDYEYYEQGGEKTLIKNRKAKTHRFFASDKGIDLLIKDLQEIKKLSEET